MPVQGCVTIPFLNFTLQSQVRRGWHPAITSVETGPAQVWLVGNFCTSLPLIPPMGVCVSGFLPKDERRKVNGNLSLKQRVPFSIPKFVFDFTMSNSKLTT